jgi:hypothetical protein
MMIAMVQCTRPALSLSCRSILILSQMKRNVTIAIRGTRLLVPRNIVGVYDLLRRRRASPISFFSLSPPARACRIAVAKKLLLIPTKLIYYGRKCT